MTKWSKAPYKYAMKYNYNYIKKTYFKSSVISMVQRSKASLK